MIDPQEYTRIAQGKRAEIHCLCYRMTGSFHDAEDLTQETFLLAWLEPYPTPEDLTIRRENISLVFLTLLQAMSPRQRAVLILMDCKPADCA